MNIKKDKSQALESDLLNASILLPMHLLIWDLLASLHLGIGLLCIIILYM